MRISLFSSLILVCYLSGCTHLRATASALPQTVPPPRFTNFETGANIKSLAFEGKFLWLGLSNGIIRYDTRTQDQYQIFTTRSTQGLLSNGIYKVAVDASGVKWVGTYGGGLSRLDQEGWTTFTPYGGGKTTFGQSWTIYPFGTGLGDLWVYDIYFDVGQTTWIATWKGVSRFDGHSFQTFTEKDGLLDKWVYAIAREKNGLFWFGTEGGVNSFDGKNWTGYTHQDGLGADVGQKNRKQADEEYSDKGYSDKGHHNRQQKEKQMANPNFVLDIAIDQNNVKWIGTWGAGLSRFDGKTWTTYTAGNGTIGGNFVHALEVDSAGILWAGTDGGITRFDGKKWITYTTADGLLDNNVFSIAFDEQGNKWFGTWTGLSKMVE